MHFIPIANIHNWRRKEFQIFRYIILITVYKQTITLLHLFQRGQRLNVFHNSRRHGNSTNLQFMPNSYSIENITETRANAISRTHNPGTITHICEEKNKIQYMPNENVLNTIKLEQELDALKEIYRIAIDSLINPDQASDNTYNGTNVFKLRCAMDTQKVNHNENELFQQQIKTTQQILFTLKNQLEIAQNEYVLKINNKNEQMGSLRHNLTHVKRVNELEYNLVERWEETRFHQAIIFGENDERNLLRQILDYKMRLTGEQRIISEVESFRNGQFMNLRKQILDWHNKLKTDIKLMHMKIQKAETQYLELTKKYELHREIYEQRMAYVAEYLTKKLEEERKIQQQVQRVNCAIRIQSWWRGTMVRRGLGIYKKKIKKSKKTKFK